MIDPGPKPHVGGPIIGPGWPSVLIGSLIAARVTDKATCVGPPDSIMVGVPTILTGSKMQARITSITAHGGTVTKGWMTVLIGP
jgi:uncharacterized Zn-binding protein involved in type VI secretion